MHEHEQQRSQPAEIAGAEEIGEQARQPGFGGRGRARRRARFLRKARELAYRDLGGLVFNLHRFGQRNDPLVIAKLSMLDRIDGELRALERALRERQPITVLREAGITACPRCAAIHGSDDRFCPNCGLSVGRHAELPVGAVAGVPAPDRAQAAPAAAQGSPAASQPGALAPPLAPSAPADALSASGLASSAPADAPLAPGLAPSAPAAGPPPAASPQPAPARERIVPAPDAAPAAPPPPSGGRAPSPPRTPSRQSSRSGSADAPEPASGPAPEPASGPAPEDASGPAPEPGSGPAPAGPSPPAQAVPAPLPDEPTEILRPPTVSQ